MNSKRALFLLGISAIFVLTSCSGLNSSVCTVNCGVGGGNATVTIMIKATPLTPPASTNLLSFVTTITGMYLTPTSGDPANLTNSTPGLDFVHLQNDSFLVGTATVPAANYTSLTISFAKPTVTYCTQTLGAAGCASGSVATLTNTVVTLPVVPTTLNLTENQKLGLEIDLDLNQALTVNANQTVTTANLGNVSAYSITSLPPAFSSLGAGQLDFYDNVLGEVVEVSGQVVTILTNANGDVGATGSASTYYSTNCVTVAQACPPAVGQLVSLDTAANPDGTLALLAFDPIASVAGVAWVDGVVTAKPTSSTQFQIVAGDQSTGTATPSSLPSGTIVNVTLVNTFPFYIESHGLPIPANNFAGSTDATVLVPGMTVGLIVTGYTPASGNTLASVTAQAVTLRFSSVSGTVATTGGQNSFSINSLPSYFGLTTNAIVQLNTVSPATNFDGVTAATGLTVGNTVAIRALYFGPNTATPFVAAKVRQF